MQARKGKDMKKKWKIIDAVVGFALLMCSLTLAVHAEETIRTARQEALHDAAETLRSAGYAEDSEVIRTLQDEWLREQEALDILAKVIDHEADPKWCEWDHSVAVGVVVLNRVRSPYFPGTVKEVVAQPGQYLAAYTRDFAGTSRLAYEAAKAALDGDHRVPEDCFWQDTHVQGVSIWRSFTVDTGWFRSTTYICRGIPGVRE